MKILVTGAAGFIGYHVAQRLCTAGHEIIGFDNLNDYYDPRLKQARLAQLKDVPTFQFVRGDLTDLGLLQQLFETHAFDRVVHLAAQAGVRYSLENPHAYVASNLAGFVNVLELCRHYPCAHLIYASSSSVYGNNSKVPFCEDDAVDSPVSLYAATKRSNELLAHTYSHLFQLPTTGLRFFTVYGPWGRPDMAMWLFTKAILNDQPINVFNQGQLQRDFTYIDDIVEGILRLVERPVAEIHPTGTLPYRILNIGNNSPVELMSLIRTLEQVIGKTAIKHFKPMQPGDVHATFANVDAISELTGFAPNTSLHDGVSRFVSWYKNYIHEENGNGQDRTGHRILCVR